MRDGLSGGRLARCLCLRLCPCLWLLVQPALLPALTITEIHYRPPAGAGNLQFVELFNDASTALDLSGYFFSSGIQFAFPEGTFLAGRSYLVVAADADIIKSRYAISNVVGSFQGSLDPAGETVEVASNSGVVQARVSYRDRGKWPAAPKGTGHTLSLAGPYLDPDDGEHWRASLERGGTPGKANFSNAGSRFEETEVIPADASWRYRKGTGEFSSPTAAWREPGYNDSAWAAGPTGIGYGDGDDATVLEDMLDSYYSVACRKSFTLSSAQLAETNSVALELRYDDGFVAYVNGTEAARAGLGNPGEATAFDDAADDHEAGPGEEFVFPKSLLVAGPNILAVEVHNTALTSSDLTFIPRLVLRRERPSTPAAPPLAINELFSRIAGEGWVEIWNAGSSAIDLGGYHLSDDPERLDRHTFPAGTVLAAGGFLVRTEADTGFDLHAREVSLFLSLPDMSRVIDARVFEVAGPAAQLGTSDARYPDGASSWIVSTRPTRGEANVLEVERDLVLNEILYHPFVSRPAAGQPLEARPGEFIEIHNRGSRAISLERYALTKGVEFAFPAGTEIGPGGYLVVGQDPAYLAAVYGIPNVLGPWKGVLQDGGETIRLEDPLGNAVDEVKYSDGGDWPELADGGGSSLELIDPRQDNSAGSAWEASDETAKAAWAQLSYNGTYQELGESLFRITPMDTGSFLLDDVEILRGAVNHVPNPGFETGTSPWVMEGTLIHSKRITTERHSGNACLEVVATDRGDLRVNRLAVLTAPSLSQGSYAVRFWARWKSGGNLILAHGFDNDIARALWLPVPRDLGTPGKENGATARLRAGAGAANLGPVVKEVRQEPPRPAPGQAVAVIAEISDADGIASAEVRWRTGGRGDGVFSAAPMHADSGGRWRADLPGFADGERVLYFVAATDSAGRSRFYPTGAPERTLLFQAGGRAPVGGPLISYRLILDDDRLEELEARRLQSDDPLYGSFTFEDEEIYHQVGLHYHGSPWERPGTPRSFKLVFPADRTLHGVKRFNISRYGSSANEAAAYYTIGRGGRPGAPSPRGDYRFVRWEVNGEDEGVMGHVETVDKRYVERWFAPDEDGLLFRANGKITFRLDESWSLSRWASLEDLGADKERYRWNWDLHTRELEDEWSPFLDLMRLMDPSTTPSGPAFDVRAKAVLDVEELARILAVRVLNDDWDTVGLVNGQNVYLYYAPREGRWKYIPWDMDGTFNNREASFYPSGDPGLDRLFERPEFFRSYLQSMREALAATWNEPRLSPYLRSLANAGVGNTDGIINFVNARRPAALEYVNRGGTFAITTSGGRDFSVAAESVTLEGGAPLEVREIVAGDDPTVRFTWTDVLRWRTQIPLVPGENPVKLFGFDAEGKLVASAAITVTSTIVWKPPAISSVEPSSGPASGGTPVTIRGSDFHSGVAVSFGAEPAASTTLVSASEVSAVTPAGSGTVDVSLANRDGQAAVFPEAFTYRAPVFVRGDADGDGAVKLNDALAILEYLFRGRALSCLSAADATDGGDLDISDPVRVLLHLFAGGPPLPPPHPAAGEDPTPDALGCARE